MLTIQLLDEEEIVTPNQTGNTVEYLAWCLAQIDQCPDKTALAALEKTFFMHLQARLDTEILATFEHNAKTLTALFAKIQDVLDDKMIKFDTIVQSAYNGNLKIEAGLVGSLISSRSFRP